MAGPFEDENPLADGYRPILAWPVAEDARHSPTFYWYTDRRWDNREHRYSIAQVKTPTADGVRYWLRRAVRNGAEDAWCTWRRGDPWWSKASFGGLHGVLLSEEDLARVREDPGFDWHGWLCAREPGLCPENE